ncbi:hypothetical protein UY3_17756 [Chelonia mydas]|uniref:Uncharacterized protein n=1 Tax=Chelonia mydas TaxID=8469 RepID=M7AQH9_CHEMY|nr:hypothetical protein UY3_17756 [Chelonia mydas]
MWIPALLPLAPVCGRLSEESARRCPDSYAAERCRNRRVLVPLLLRILRASGRGPRDPRLPQPDTPGWQPLWGLLTHPGGGDDYIGTRWATNAAPGTPGACGHRWCQGDGPMR